MVQFNVQESNIAEKEDHLQGDNLIFNEHFLGEEISADRRLILLAKLLVHISNHCQAKLFTSKVNTLKTSQQKPYTSTSLSHSRSTLVSIRFTSEAYYLCSEIFVVVDFDHDI
jgi:hypothetical protein